MIFTTCMRTFNTDNSIVFLHVAAYARMAIRTCMICICHCFPCGMGLYQYGFDSGVLPILNYGAEIWGYGKHPKCDNSLNRVMRYFLGKHPLLKPSNIDLLNCYVWKPIVSSRNVTLAYLISRFIAC